MIHLGNIRIDISDTGHGPEIAVYEGMGCTTLTVFEFEQFVHKAKLLASTARAKTSVRARNAGLPMRT